LTEWISKNCDCVLAKRAHVRTKGIIC
jgi:hypothetical protein